MKKSTIFLAIILIVSALSCKKEQVPPTKTGTTPVPTPTPTQPVSTPLPSVLKYGVSTEFIDIETPENAAPCFVSDSLTRASKKWLLVFSDEFNDDKINTSKWTVENRIIYREDVTLYANNNQVEEKAGKAFLYYQKSSLHDSAYFAGRMNSKGKFATTYGYLECRMHVVKPNGHQTAFWMMPSADGPMLNNGIKDGTANDGAEIDIVEGNKLTTYSTGLHWDGYAAPFHMANGTNIQAPNLHTVEYHVWGFEWSPTFLKFYYDGKLVRTLTSPHLIPHTPHYIIFSGSCWGVNTWVNGNIKTNSFIQQGKRDEAYIDYMRVYKR